MSLESDLRARAESRCELCGASENLATFPVGPNANDTTATSILACATCRDQMDETAEIEVNHWRCLNDSMWSSVPAVQVTAWRMLTKLNGEPWARDLLDMLYLDDETLAWAMSGVAAQADEDSIQHQDCNGAVLAAGDTVVLIKDLNVKGAGFTAKRGTAVRNISLVFDNPKHIEGRVNGQQIVILTEFVKKST